MPVQDVYTFSYLQRWSEVAAGVEPPIRLSVLGDPVAHSKSPPIHNAALRHCGIDAQYARLHVRPEELRETLSLLPALGFFGTNITLPHKTAAMALVDDVDEHARKMGAINTVVIDGGKRIGFNTDGPGFVRAIRNEFSVDLRDLGVMVLGAGGGAGRAIAVQCALEHCERLVLVNRTVEKARELAAELAPYFKGPRVSGPVARLEALSWESVRAQIPHVDLVVNATPLGMRAGDVSPVPAHFLAPHLFVYDTIYTSPRTKFMQAAEEAGARSANGSSMLLHQGALSFELWFNREAPLEIMRAALQSQTGVR